GIAIFLIPVTFYVVERLSSRRHATAQAPQPEPHAAPAAALPSRVTPAIGFDSYSPQSQLMHCSKRFYLYFVRGVLSQQVRRSKTHIVVVAALETFGVWGP